MKKVSYLKSTSKLHLKIAKSESEEKNKPSTANGSSEQGVDLRKLMKHIVVQPFDLPVFVCTDRKKYVRVMNSLLGEDISDHVNSSLGITSCIPTQEGSIFFMLLPTDFDEEVTYHECLHLVHFILDYTGIGVEFSEPNSEFQCYLQSHIVREVKAKLYNKKGA